WDSTWCSASCKNTEAMYGSLRARAIPVSRSVCPCRTLALSDERNPALIGTETFVGVGSMSTILESVAFGKPFWRGWGLWRIPHFFRALRLDSPQFGLANAARYNFRRLTMPSAARQLPRSAEPAQHEPLPVYFMSGREHWAMTAFCAFSLLESTNSNVVPMVMDDGTLGAMERDELKRILPRA